MTTHTKEYNPTRRLFYCGSVILADHWHTWIILHSAWVGAGAA